MEALIKVNVELDGRHSVDARDLWEKLEVGYSFRDWIKNRISEYGFQEGEDFRFFLSESRGGRPGKEYAISLDMAKELCMVERSETGRKFRKYFIEVEKRFRKITETPIAPVEITDEEFRKNRNEFTATCAHHGVKGWAIAGITNIQYSKLFGQQAKQIIQARGPNSKTARALLSKTERLKLVAHENLTALSAATMQAKGWDDMRYCVRISADGVHALIGQSQIVQSLFEYETKSLEA